MILTQLLLGPLLLAMTLFFKAFPAKNINGLYGYRTARSMKSQAAWEASNKYAFSLMLWVAIITCIVQILLYLLSDETTTLIYTCVVMCTLLVAIIPLTESFLKKNFDADGNPRKS